MIGKEIVVIEPDTLKLRFKAKERDIQRLKRLQETTDIQLHVKRKGADVFVRYPLFEREADELIFWIDNILTGAKPGYYEGQILAMTRDECCPKPCCSLGYPVFLIEGCPDVEISNTEHKLFDMCADPYGM